MCMPLTSHEEAGIYPRLHFTCDVKMVLVLVRRLAGNRQLPSLLGETKILVVKGLPLG